MTATVIAMLIAAVLVSPDPASAAAPVKQGAQVAGVAESPQRIAGRDRYDTAVRISSALQGPVPVVFVATGTDFPDALAATAAAGALGGPLLLTRPTVLPDEVRKEIIRLAPERIVVVGGSSVVGAGVQRLLDRIAPTSRLQGANRYATSVALSAAEFDTSEQVFLATGRDYPDALVSAAAAGGAGAPVLLVDGKATTIPSATLREMRRLGATRVSVVGGYGAVRAELQAALGRAGMQVSRYAGANRYDTAAALNDAFFPEGSAQRALLATGADFPDALAGAASAAGGQMPMFVVPKTCAYSATISTAARIGVSSTVVLGGTSVVSEASARLEPCTKPDPGSVLDQQWIEQDLSLDAGARLPYWDRPPVDVRAADQIVDATGLRIYRTKTTGARADHPVVYAQYGISALLEYERTGERTWLRRAIRQAERLIEMRTLRGGGWWYAYSFDWTYDNRTLNAPWWSGMAQGQALSLFSRLAQIAPAARWDAAVAGTWQSFTQSRSASQQWSSVVLKQRLYFEEYAGDQKPLQVLNGQIFAMFGVYDYWRLSGDPDAERLLRGSSATVLDMMPSIRKRGDVSYYCVQPAFCQRPMWQNQKYHVIHSWQLETLAALTGVTEFRTWADTLRTDWAPMSRFSRMESSSDAPVDADPLDIAQAGVQP
ncbi:cell wall-binding repeat-containing protein [Microbacterium sp. USHLN186]|uniref:cell wall-binding repeat-containing protein n=1 Tax=Microbacterium sp. USHLN186 TaxID=3081286 RepID=UPI003019E288